ncbi:hypothetical protein Q5424_24345 [Conexibacter sp. JD483]|uniref:hypothetical protein n=1 Tax=unclassified Conexibacter TaxID=2627773 RepID=UPI002728742F|nr:MULTISPECIES: hypothetical protein [unclassified Conexibacter]MDO8188577.1 hypothetical protein [Conexibacter sp. CPCC 205706]MDO8201476.1 hypothetical protein [Conexibacter sp. CPCC 205762]MDR9372251.1 hypothetical protein [Conexibacter sp. JD483]
MRTVTPLATALAALALAVVPGAARAAEPPSCDALAGGTVNAIDAVPWAQIPAAGSLRQWPAAPAGLLPARVDLRGATESFNQRYQFATRGGQLYVAERAGSAAPATADWRALPLPGCFAGRVASISADDDELIAIDRDRRVFTLDNALKGPDLFNWSKRWGPPLWTGPGRRLPGRVVAWSWSVLSPAEDRTWTDVGGTRHPVGERKVSHIWALRDGGRRMTFMDPWLPDDDSYEMCGPYRSRFRAVNLSASGSQIFVIGAHGDLFTRLYDFDLAGHDEVFLRYVYARTAPVDGVAPIELPAPAWVRQPKVPGTITSAIGIEKSGVGARDAILRVEGRRGARTGYWEKRLLARSARAWRFHAGGRPLQGRVLDNPQRDSSRSGLAPRAEDVRFSGAPDVLRRVTVADFNVHCTPARLTVAAGRATVALRLHSVDALRQVARARGLDADPRALYGTIEVPPAVRARAATLPPALRALLRGPLHGRYTKVSVTATTRELTIGDGGALDWRLTR